MNIAVIPRHGDALPPGHMLKEYRIERVLRTTGFTIGYLATDPAGREVTLREYFPAPWARRANDEVGMRPDDPGHAERYAAGLACFRAEAQVLLGFHHPGVVQAVDYFEDGGTAYLVCDHVEGETLASILLRAGTLPEDAVYAFLMPLLDALEALHRAGLVHGDINPDNVILRDADGLPMLLDLAHVRHALARLAGAEAPAENDAATWGYAAIDEYPEGGGEDGPRSDVYGLGATLYSCIAGIRPCGARERVRERIVGGPDSLVPAAIAGRDRYSPRLLAAIDAALRIQPGERPASIAGFRALLDPASAAAATRPWRAFFPGLRASILSRVAAPRRSKAYVAVAAAAAVLAAYVLFQMTTSPPEPDPFAIFDAAEVARRDAALRPPSDIARRPGTAFHDCIVCPEMVVIPAGKFTMGAPASERNAAAEERPQRAVSIARPFALGRFEVTVAEYTACVAAGRCFYENTSAPWGAGRMPVVRVSWDDAKTYVQWLSARTGKTYRLPTEAEWEYAARAGGTRPYSWGERVGRNRANCADCGSRWDDERPAPVGSFRPNRFGVHDMLGNVWEWIEDCWRPSHAGAPADGSAVAAPNCATRVMRGGAWDVHAWGIRVTSRTHAIANEREGLIGIRVVRDLD